MFSSTNELGTAASIDPRANVSKVCYDNEGLLPNLFRLNPYRWCIQTTVEAEWEIFKRVEQQWL